MIASAPPAIVPVVIVVLFALGTALGFVIVRQAIAERAAQLVPRAATDARAALAALQADAPPAAVYAQLAGSLRAYLDARFAIEAAALPGAEVERTMTRAGVARPAARMTAHLLERCDRMQAADAGPVAPERIAADLANAREIIDLTSGGA